MTGEDRKENDLEHSGQLALVAWYFNESLNLKLDNEMLLKYSLAHDLVETYAGDISFFDSTERKYKKKNEEKASLLLLKNYPEFEYLHQTIISYEELNTEEAKFVYTLDKLIPVINIYLDEGRSWRLERVSFDKLKQLKMKNIKQNKIIKEYFLQLIKLLEENEDKLFG